jgi:hypothetical protein
MKMFFEAWQPMLIPDNAGWSKFKLSQQAKID